MDVTVLKLYYIWLHLASQVPLETLILDLAKFVTTLENLCGQKLRAASRNCRKLLGPESCITSLPPQRNNFHRQCNRLESIFFLSQAYRWQYHWADNLLISFNILSRVQIQVSDKCRWETPISLAIFLHFHLFYFIAKLYQITKYTLYF